MTSTRMNKMMVSEEKEAFKLVWTFNGLIRSLSLLIFAAALLMALQSQARFSSHLTTPALTLMPGALSFEPFPGASTNTSVLANSLSVGLTPSMQIGFVPLFLVIPGHRYNVNLKLNVLDRNYFQAGVGYSHFSLHLVDNPQIREENGSLTNNPWADLGFVFLALNYKGPDEPWGWGLNYSLINLTSNSALLEKLLREKVRRHEWALDVSYDWRPHWHWTLGFGESRVDTFDVGSPVTFGYGFSATWHRPDSRFFPKLSLGPHYFPSLNNLRFVFSFDF